MVDVVLGGAIGTEGAGLALAVLIAITAGTLMRLWIGWRHVVRDHPGEAFDPAYLMTGLLTIPSIYVFYTGGTPLLSGDPVTVIFYIFGAFGFGYAGKQTADAETLDKRPGAPNVPPPPGQ